MMLRNISLNNYYILVWKSDFYYYQAKITHSVSLNLYQELQLLEMKKYIIITKTVAKYVIIKRFLVSDLIVWDKHIIWMIDKNTVFIQLMGKPSKARL